MSYLDIGSFIHGFGDSYLLTFFRYIFIDPKEENVNSLYMGLEVADPESLPSGWRRYVKLRLSVGNQYLGELALLNGDSFNVPCVGNIYIE